MRRREVASPPFLACPVKELFTAEDASMKGPLESRHTSSERSAPGSSSHPGARSERVSPTDRVCSFTPAPGA
jgi:hypothetical protein